MFKGATAFLEFYQTDPRSRSSLTATIISQAKGTCSLSLQGGWDTTTAQAEFHQVLTHLKSFSWNRLVVCCTGLRGISPCWGRDHSMDTSFMCSMIELALLAVECKGGQFELRCTKQEEPEIRDLVDSHRTAKATLLSHIVIEI